MLRRRLSILLRSRIASSIAVIVGIVVAGIGGAGLLADGDDGPTADEADVRLVEDFALAVTTFDSGRVDADIGRILDFGTRDFASDFQASMGETFIEDIRASGASSVGEIVAGPTIQRTEGSTAIYFVVVNQRIIAPSSAESTGEGEGPGPDGGDAEEPSAPTAPSEESRIVRVGLLVQLDRDADLVSSVEVL